MSLVFGFPNNKGLKVSDYLTAQGINVLRCTLSGFEALVTLRLNQPAYKNYINYLPSYMEAMITQRRASILEPYHPLRYESTEPLVMTRLPDVCVSFSNVPASEALDAIRSAGGVELQLKGQKVFLLPQPDRDLLRICAQSGASRTTAASVNSVNLEALGSLNLVRRLFSCFLRTHTYPAFVDTDHLTYTGDHYLVSEGGEKRKATTSGDGAGSSRKIQKTSQLPEEEDDEDRMAEDEPEVIPPGDKILYAVPPSNLVSGWGDINDLPEGDGIFIRYIDETQNSDGERIVTNTIARYFLGALGSNAEVVRNAFDKLKKDFGIINATPVGKELSHLAKCIDIGVQAQARIFPLVNDGQYLGSVLLGAGFQIAAYGSVMSPVDSTTLKQRVEQAGSHRSALEAIANIVEDDVDSDINQTIKACTSMVILRNELRDCHLSNEDRTNVVALARKLRFNHKSLNVSVANVVECLRLVQFPNDDLVDTFPIHPSKLFDEDRLSVVWSAFGDLAPTCRFPGGPVVNLQSSKNLPKHIGFRMVPLKDALIDMQMVFTEKTFPSCSLNRRSAVFKDRIYSGLDGTNIINALVSAAGVVRAGGQRTKGDARVIDAAVFDEGF